jgi:hypothetical protein
MLGSLSSGPAAGIGVGVAALLTMLSPSLPPFNYRQRQAKITHLAKHTYSDRRYFELLWKPVS